jgi:CspA family cold shock protein
MLGALSPSHTGWLTKRIILVSFIVHLVNTLNSRRSSMSNVLTGLTRMAGTVKWFNDPKGFGFIARDDGQPDCLVHRFDFHGGEFATLAAGDRVEFAVVEREHGPWADDVTRLPRRVW